jgi:AcrR family transcriptional regulator
LYGAVTSGARRRLGVDERRAMLVEAGLRLFGDRSADEVAVEDIAREAGVSAGLLYHYFGSKKEFQAAVTAHAYAALTAATEPDPDLPAGAQLVASLTAYVEFVQRNHRWWAWLLRGGGGGDPRLEALGRELRETSVRRITARVPPEALTPTVELTVHGWVGFEAEIAVAWAEQRQSGQDGLSARDVVQVMATGLLVTLEAAGAPRDLLRSVRAEVDAALAAGQSVGDGVGVTHPSGGTDDGSDGVGHGVG